MKYTNAVRLADLLLEIQRLTTLIRPLIDEGQKEFEEFSSSLDHIIDDIHLTYTAAVAGPVGSGKSTLLSSLIKESGESGRHPIASISPSNETFAPMTIGYGPQASLVVQYFSIDVLNQIEKHLGDLQREGNQAHLVAQYRDLRNRLRKVEAVLAGEKDREIVKKISLDGLRRKELVETIRNHIAQSSKNSDVYAIYKVELTYPGNVIRQLRNVRFIDLYGFGEPSPLINVKYGRFVSEENIDAAIYVFPDRSVTEDFNRLFEIPSFLNEIVAKGRLFLVLNKADAYTDVGVSQWPHVLESFRKVLSKHSPILKKHLKDVRLFVLSAASIDGTIAHSKAEQIRKQSLRNLQSLRDELKGLSEELEHTASDPSVYLGALFDLLGSLDVLAKGAQMRLERLEKRIPAISKLIDEVSERHTEFADEAERRLHDFRFALENEVVKQLGLIEYGNVLPGSMGDSTVGEPKALFRSMLEAAQVGAQTVFDKWISGRMFGEIGRFVDTNLLEAYREYVALQDEALLSEMEQLSGGTRIPFQPLSTTVEHSAKDFLLFSRTPRLHFGARGMFERFTHWFLRNRCKWDAERGKEIGAIRSEVSRNLEGAIEVFMRLYILEDESLSPSYLSHVCVGGEKTFWKHLQSHIRKLDELLGNQVRISKWKFGLYKNKKFFVSNRPAYQENIRELLAKKNSAESLIVELV